MKEQHFTDDLLIEYMERRLQSSKSSSVELHLLECEMCRQRYEQTLRLREGVRAVFKKTSEKQVTPELDLAVFSHIEGILQSRRRIKTLRFVGLATAAVFLASVILFLVMQFYRANEPQSASLENEHVARKSVEEKQGIQFSEQKEQYIKGDVNNDGKVDIIDAQLIQIELLRDEGALDTRRGDVTGDGVVDVCDVQAIAKDVLRGAE